MKIGECNGYCSSVWNLNVHGIEDEYWLVFHGLKLNEFENWMDGNEECSCNINSYGKKPIHDFNSKWLNLQNCDSIFNEISLVLYKMHELFLWNTIWIPIMFMFNGLMFTNLVNANGLVLHYLITKKRSITMNYG